MMHVVLGEGDGGQIDCTKRTSMDFRCPISVEQNSVLAVFGDLDYIRCDFNPTYKLGRSSNFQFKTKANHVVSKVRVRPYLASFVIYFLSFSFLISFFGEMFFYFQLLFYDCI